MGKRLAAWDSDDVPDYLAAHASFDRIIELGPDPDAVPPYHDNYGRHQFGVRGS